MDKTMYKEELTQIVKTVQNDKEQFELLYSQIVKKVYYWCFMVMGNEADALDASQESMLRIYENINMLKNPEMFISWMYRVVRNVCLNCLKKQNRRDLEYLHNDMYEQGIESTIIEEGRDKLPQEAYELKETKQLIIEFIGNLPKKQREVITLFYLEELKVDEIAYILDYNAGSVKSRLHSGRKSLEHQIKDYQEKHNVKLYSLSLLPMLGLILQEHREIICQRRDLSFDKTIYRFSHPSSLSNLINIITTKIAIIGSTVVLVSALVVGSLFLYQVKDTLNEHVDNRILTHNLEDFDKGKVNPYIESIIYSSFPTRTYVDISIQLKKDIANKDVKIIFEQEEVEFVKDGKEILIQAKKNGEYAIIINKKKTKFTIDRIDEFAPELLAITNYGNYLELNINDELAQIDYNRSYVEYFDEQYKITNDLNVIGNFQGTIVVVIFDKHGNFIRYKDNTSY